MESVVLDKPPEYHGMCDERGFPFEEDDGRAWSELASRHPDIAARLRPRAPGSPAAAGPHPPPNAQAFQRKRRPDHADQQDFGANFDGFDRFPFDNIPPEFRGHLPPQYYRRYEEPPAQPQQHPNHPQHPQNQPQQPQKQTIATQTDPEDIVPQPIPLPHIPFDQVQNQPDQEATNLQQQGFRNPADVHHPSHPEQVNAEDHTQQSAPPPAPEHHPNMSQEHSQDGAHVRVIPIQVEGRDAPVQNHRAASPAQQYPHPHQHPHAPPFDDGFRHQTFAPPPPFRAGFNTNPRPYTTQKAYPQGGARSMSPQPSNSPKPFVEIPVQHEGKPQQQHPNQQQQNQQYQQQQQQQFQQQQNQQPQQPKTPPPPPQNTQKDPITQILAIQTDVLKLMTEVENFTGSKKDKQYIYLDEMLTRNLLNLDNIETEGKENIRAARKEAIRCIQKCIAVLEAKAEKGSQALAQDVEMKQDSQSQGANGEADADKPKENAEELTEGGDKPQVDTRPEGKEETDKEKKGKKGGKNVKKRDKSKDKNAKDGAQVDSKDNAEPSQAMDVDGAASQ